MSQPIGNCPGCGSDQAFEQIHAGQFADTRCPDTDGGDCPEWACTACGAAVIMGTIPSADDAVTAGRQSFRAA